MGRLKANEIDDYFNDDVGYDKDLNRSKKKKIDTIYKRQARQEKREKL